METFKLLLLVFLILCAISASLIKNPLLSVIVFMSYSLIMSIIWFLLESPDLAITEAAVGRESAVFCFCHTAQAESAFRSKRRSG